MSNELKTNVCIVFFVKTTKIRNLAALVLALSGTLFGGCTNQQHTSLQEPQKPIILQGPEKKSAILAAPSVPIGSNERFVQVYKLKGNERIFRFSIGIEHFNASTDNLFIGEKTITYATPRTSLVFFYSSLSEHFDLMPFGGMYVRAKGMECTLTPQGRECAIDHTLKPEADVFANVGKNNVQLIMSFDAGRRKMFERLGYYLQRDFGKDFGIQNPAKILPQKDYFETTLFPEGVVMVEDASKFGIVSAEARRFNHVIRAGSEPIIVVTRENAEPYISQGKSNILVAEGDYFNLYNPSQKIELAVDGEQLSPATAKK